MRSVDAALIETYSHFQSFNNLLVQIKGRSSVRTIQQFSKMHSFVRSSAMSGFSGIFK